VAESDNESVGQTWATTIPHVSALAELLLRAAAIGAPCAELARALAESVIDQAVGVRLAIEVLAGGEHMTTRAIELAEAMLKPVDAARREQTS
jgi:hypothetical protein